MKIIEMFLMAFLSIKLAVAVTESPRPLFDALHEAGEARELLEMRRAEILLFAGIRTMRAILWMAEVVHGIWRGARNDFVSFVTRNHFVRGRTYSLHPNDTEGETMIHGKRSVSIMTDNEAS